MKKLLIPHNAVLVFSVFLVLWAVYSFFTWHLRPLPKNIPAEIVNKINTKGFPGEPVFLSSQLMDEFVLNHPDLNIFPAGGESLKNAETMRSFYIIESFQGLDCKDVSKDLEERQIFSSDGYVLKECTSSKNGEQSFAASSFVDKFTVTVPPSTTPVEFKRGVFRTGHNGWQKIEAGSAQFNKKRIVAISAHPLPESREIKIELPSIDRKTLKILASCGVADSGRMKGSKPVDLKISQNGLEQIIHSADGKWSEHELIGFSPFQPISITISTKNSAKRHFYFDVRYVLGGK